MFFSVSDFWSFSGLGGGIKININNSMKQSFIHLHVLHFFFVLLNYKNTIYFFV